MLFLRLPFHLRTVMVGLVAAVLIAALVPMSASAEEGQKVTQIVITGNDNINKDAIESVIKLSVGSQYDKNAVEQDRRAIDALGYFSAVSTRTEDTPEGVRVIYDVVENLVVRQIELTGLGPISQDTILNLMRTKPGQVLNYSTLNMDIDAIQNYYREEGYVAFVTEDVGIDRETGLLSIPLLVNTVHSVQIVGNKKTKTQVFLREMKTKPGTVFNRKTLRDDIARIYNLDVLEDIHSPKIEPNTIGSVDITIPVTERRTGNLGIGIGYSSRSKLVGRVELTETNFRGRGQGLTLLWETGTSGGLGGSGSYEIGFTEPWIDKHNTSLSINVFNKLLYRFSSSLFGTTTTDDQVKNYNERRKGARVGLSRPLNDFTRAFVMLRGETVDTSTLDISRFAPSDVNRFVAQNGPVRSATVRLVHNTRDFDRDPADGWFRSVSLEAGTSDVLEEFTELDTETPTTYPNGLTIGNTTIKGPFQKLEVDVRRYMSSGGRKVTPTDKRNVLAFRFHAGFSSGDLPFFEQFFVGGSETLRGYREDRFWGTKMAFASAEYRKPVSQGLTGVLFVDAGDAWDAPRSYSIGDKLEQHEGFSPSVGGGIGLRVSTPVGNLRFDYGIGSEGGRTHFSIGQAF